jgi:hypothetical protein
MFRVYSSSLTSRSAVMLLQQVNSLKQEVVSRPLPRPPSWDVYSIRLLHSWFFHSLTLHHQWEAMCVGSDNPLFEFPEKHLLDKMIYIYFERLNICIPLPHQPTFKRGLHNGLHLRDIGFAQVVLMACALAC